MSKFKSVQKSKGSGIHKPLPVMPASPAAGVKNILKQVNEPARNNSPQPKFNPVSNKMLASAPVPTPLKRTQINAVQLNIKVSEPALVIPPVMPRASTNQMTLPKPVSSGRSKLQNIFAPTINNSAVSNQETMVNSPAPVNVLSNDKYLPTPVSANVLGHNANQRIAKAVDPIRAHSDPGGFPGIRGPAISPVISGHGEPGVNSGEHATVNPPNTLDNKGPISTPALPTDFGPYMADLQRRIKHNWFPPKAYESKKIEVVFRIHRGGELTDLKVLKSSGFAAADEAALRAVLNAAPFHNLPPHSPECLDI